MTKRNRTRGRTSPPEPLLTLRLLAILTASCLVGSVAAAVTYAKTHDLSSALVAAPSLTVIADQDGNRGVLCVAEFPATKD